MNLLERYRFGERRPRRSFHIVLEINPSDPSLLMSAKAGNLDGYLLTAVCNEDGEAVAVLGRLPLSLGEGSLLQVAELVAADWGPTLGLALNCDWNRIEWVALDGEGAGFAASQPGGAGPWVSLEDLGGPSGDLLRQFVGVFPEMERFASARLRPWLAPAALDESDATGLTAQPSMRA